MKTVKIQLGGHRGPIKGYALIDEDDFERLSKHKWSSGKDVYALTKIKIKGIWTTKYMHRMIMNPPKHLEIDHINGNRIDNRKSNLRICTGSQNNANKKVQSNSTSGIKGVFHITRSTRKKGNWGASISVNKKKIYLGYFEDKLEAAKAYNEASKKYHGEFSNLTPLPTKQD